MSAGFRAGTEAQHNFIERLCQDPKSPRRFPSALEACMHVLGRRAEDLEATPPSVDDTRKVISFLKGEEGSAPAPAPAGVRPKKDGRFTTAKQLHDYATGAARPPETLDQYATWVLTRLAAFERVIAALPPEIRGALKPAPTLGVNGDGPILMEHVVAYFGSWDKLAEALRVTVPTAKAWGAMVPESRVYEVEVKTGGYVRVPRGLRS